MKTFACKTPRLVFAACALLPMAAPAAEVSIPVSECVYGWTAKYDKTGTTITVRVKLVPDSGITASQLTALKSTWSAGIAQKWSEKFACATGQPKLTFGVQFVDSNAHHTVRVQPGPARSNMNLWDDKDDGHAASHEFGHMIGMRDEYADAQCPSRAPVGTGTVMEVNTGPSAQRHITAVCNGTPSEPPTEPLTSKKGAPRPPAELPGGAPSTAKFTAGDLTKPIRFRLVISGGAPGERAEYVVDVNEADKTSRVSHLDQLRKQVKQQFQTPYASETIKSLRDMLQQGSLPQEAAASGPFPPDTLVATLTVEAGGKRQVLQYAVSENALPPGEAPAREASLGALQPVEAPAALKKLHELATREAQRVITRSGIRP